MFEQPRDEVPADLDCGKLWLARHLVDDKVADTDYQSREIRYSSHLA